MGLYNPPLTLYEDRTAKNSDRVKEKFLWMCSSDLNMKHKCNSLYKNCETIPGLINGFCTLTILGN